MNFPAKNFSGRKKLLQHSLVARVSSPLEKRHVDREGSCLLAVKSEDSILGTCRPSFALVALNKLELPIVEDWIFEH